MSFLQNLLALPSLQVLLALLVLVALPFMQALLALLVLVVLPSLHVLLPCRPDWPYLFWWP